MVKYTLTFIVVFFAAAFCSAQSTHSVLLNLEKIKSANLDSAKQYATHFLTNTNEKKGDAYIEVKIELANILRVLGDLDSALVVIDQVEQSWSRSADIQVKKWIGKADILGGQGKTEQALSYYLKALELAEKFNIYDQLGLVYNNLGANYLFQTEYQDALAYFYKSLEVRKTIKDTVGTVKVLNNLGATHCKLLQLDSARIYYTKSIEIRKIINDQKGINTAYLNIAILDQIEGERENAVEIYKKIIRSSIEIKDYEMCVLAHINMGNAYIFSDEIGLAESSLLKALEYGEKYNVQKHTANIYLSLAKLYEKKGDASQVLNYRRLYHAAYVDRFNQEKQKEISRLKVQYNLKEKDREIAELSRQKIAAALQLKEEELKQNQFLFWVYLVFTVLAVSILFLILLYFRKRKFALAQEKSSKEREILLKEVHHRVKNNLQIVSSLLSMQGKIGTEIDANEMLRQAQNRIHSIAIIHEKLYQSTSLADVKLDAYFKQLIEHLSASYDLEGKGIKITCEAEEVALHLDQIVPCGLILNELITNSIKHAFEDGGIISIKGSVENDNIVIDIKDDGKGLSQDFDLGRSQSLGLKLSKGLAKQLKGTLQLITPSTAHFQLKINQIYA